MLILTLICMVLAVATTPKILRTIFCENSGVGGWFVFLWAILITEIIYYALSRR